MVVYPADKVSALSRAGKPALNGTQLNASLLKRELPSLTARRLATALAMFVKQPICVVISDCQVDLENDRVFHPLFLRLHQPTSRCRVHQQLGELSHTRLMVE